MPVRSPTTLRTFTASAVTSPPIPSPGITAIRAVRMRFRPIRGSAGDYLQAAGCVVRRAAERILAGRRTIERDDPGGIGRDERRAAALARAPEEIARHTVQRDAVEDDRMRAAVARRETNHVALARLYRGRLEFAAVPACDVYLLQ